MPAGRVEVLIRDARWATESDTISAIRRTVFALEQGVPIEIELDGLDPSCKHALALLPDGRAVGTARIREDGHIGRIAVLVDWRRRGIGARLVEHMTLWAVARELQSVDLDSQEHAIGFYERLGFAVSGETFVEAGIPHRNMVRRLR